MIALKDQPLQHSQIVKPLVSWTPQEQWVWERISEGQLADLNDYEEMDDPLRPADAGHWPQSRILRPSFLRRILLDESYRQVIPAQGVRISGARFSESLDLADCQLSHEVWLHECSFEQPLQLQHIRTPRDLSLTRLFLSRSGQPSRCHHWRRSGL